MNIEFEAKVFKDLIMKMGVYSAFFKQETEEEERVYFEYIRWIDDVMNDFSILHSRDKYKHWLDLFKKHNPEYYSPKSSDFWLFHGLYDLINISNCF